MYDYLIKNATIVDGTGSAPFQGSVAIENGQVAAVGDVDGSAKETVDANGAHLTPGSIRPERFRCSTRSARSTSSYSAPT